MDPEIVQKREERIESVEKEIADLRQELVSMHEIFTSMGSTPAEKQVKSKIEQEMDAASAEDENEFEGIWAFHERLLVADAAGVIPADSMYAAFVIFCHANGKIPLEQDAFEFLLPQMDDPCPVHSGENWTGCRFR
ncbi:MAG: primase-like DNA-binding domain-containing protein [Methanoregula sp.]